MSGAAGIPVPLYLGDEHIGNVRPVGGRVSRWGVWCAACRTSLVDTGRTKEHAESILSAHMFEHDDEVAA